MSEKILSVSGVTKEYDNAQVLKGLSLELFSDEIFCLIGPNGAGKTTLAKIIMGLEKQDSGTVSFFNGKTAREVRGQIAIVPQQNSFYSDFTVEQNLNFFGALYGLEKSDLENNVSALLDWLSLKKFADRKARNLSGGYKRLLNIACSLIHGPEIIFMDEPTVGLDPNMRQIIWKKINDLKKSGKAILLTTHYMDEAQELSDRVAMMIGGEIIVEGNPHELIRRHGGEKIMTLQLDKPPSQKIRDSLSKALSGSRVKSIGSFLIISFMQKHSIEKISAMVEWLVAQGYSIVKSSIKEPELEDVFFNITGESMVTGERVEQ